MVAFSCRMMDVHACMHATTARIGLYSVFFSLCTCVVPSGVFFFFARERQTDDKLRTLRRASEPASKQHADRARTHARGEIIIIQEKRCRCSIPRQMTTTTTQTPTTTTKQRGRRRRPRCYVRSGDCRNRRRRRRRQGNKRCGASGSNLLSSLRERPPPEKKKGKNSLHQSRLSSSSSLKQQCVLREKSRMATSTLRGL